MGYMEYESDTWAFLIMVAIIIIIILRDKITFFTKFKRQSPTTIRSEQPDHHTPEQQISVQRYAGNMPAVKGIFVVVTAPDPQTQLVAMSLSTQVMMKGKSVRILLCGPGGDLALRGGKEVILKPINKSPQMLLKNLISKKVKVEICPFYLANRGGSPADLIEGITPAAPAVVADGLIEPGIKLFTF